MSKKIFATFFLNYQDFHFFKDPGQIPYRFSKLGYDSKIICRKNGDYPITRKYLGMDFIQSKFFLGFDISIYYYFLRNSRKISILNVFHLDYWENLLAAFLYKTLNPKGKVYLKMDNCKNCGIAYNWEKLFDPKIDASNYFDSSAKNWKISIKNFLIKKLFVKKIDLFSVEDEDSADYYERKYFFFKDKLITAYNGHTVDLFDKIGFELRNFENKENIIMTAARLGTYPKNSLNLLKGFSETSNFHNWRLILAGEINKNFLPELDNFFINHPELMKRIEFTGELDKLNLFELYNKSKIFILPSNYEGFSNVFPEAMYFGNAIITTPFTSLKKIISSFNIGLLVDPNNPTEIGSAILELIANENKLKVICENSRKFALEFLDWDKIVNKINSKLSSNRI